VADDDPTPSSPSGSSPADAHADDVVDELPEELQPALASDDDYVFPNNSRRRVPAVLYAALAVICVVVYATVDSPAVNGGWLGAAALLGFAALYCWLAGANLAVDEHEALVAATVDVGFPVGHASAQLGWRGLLSRPTWRVLLYSAEDPPQQRGLIFVDGLDGHIVERIVQDNPEDWSALAAYRT
jgi:hypothetical protein